METGRSVPLKAIRYSSLDEAKAVLADAGGDPAALDDGSQEPEGLLSVIAESMVAEEVFIHLFAARRGTLVEVEEVAFSGFGPPAEETDYAGYVSRQVAYVLLGCGFEIHIAECPAGATDLYHLEAMIQDGQHPLNREDLAARLQLPEDWEFEDLSERVVQGILTASQIDAAIHKKKL